MTDQLFYSNSQACIRELIEFLSLMIFDECRFRHFVGSSCSTYKAISEFEVV